MPIARKFLDWSQPALPSAADYLIERYVRAADVDLDEVTVAVPGARAGRRLLELLVARCEQRRLRLTPPQIKTVGQLPELLYESKRPFASDLVQQLAWVHSLRSEGRRKLMRTMPALPDEDDVPRWLALGKLLWKQHRELAAEGLDFGDVVKVGWRRGETREKNRWKLFHRVQQNYLRILDHFELWDLQTARLFAIDHRECRADADIILVGAADLNGAMRRMLDQVADRVTALVFAPQSLSGRFDRHGCLDAENWQEAEIDLRDDQLVLADGPADQAEEVARELARYAGRFRADEIAIGVPDPTLAPQIQLRLRQAGVPTRYAVGRVLPQTPPFRLLEAIADYLERGRFEEFAALVRHADVSRWIDFRCGATAHGWLTQLDTYFSRHLQPKLAVWLGNPDEHDRLREAHAWLEQLVEPLSMGRKKLGHWASELVAVVGRVYEDLELDRHNEHDHYTLEACQAIHAALVEIQSAPEQLQPILTATQAIRLLLEQLQANELAPLPDDSAVELLGWLELPLDTSSALVVTSFNEGCVPTSVNADLFLPNGLRKRLGLLDNRRRYSRDAYAMGLLRASRKQLKLIVGRRNFDGDALAPSRLLFATNLHELGRRCLRFFSGDDASVAGVSMRSPRPQTDIFVPRAAPPAEPVDSMSVTSFRSYLACPYRFYLRHVLNLAPVDDAAEELDAPTYGSLIHDVLNQFGRGPQRDSDNADHIRSFLNDSLRKLVRYRFGSTHLAPVKVQLTQLRMRLDAFARWQAAWRADGWEIAFAESPEMVESIELPIGGSSAGDVGEETMTVRGRIDRIDHNTITDQWIIFDYKASESARKPEEAHQQGRRWIDLQLPLYRRFAEAMGIRGEVGLGYIVLPKDTKQVGERIAQWSEREIQDADAQAIEVARKVRKGEFWPPTEPPPDILGEFASICQDHAFEKRWEEEPLGVAW